MLQVVWKKELFRLWPKFIPKINISHFITVKMLKGKKKRESEDKIKTKCLF